MKFGRLFLLYAILIFAKKAPQLIKDLLNIKGDNVGLKGLNIKNKMGEAALIGDKVKKGMMAAEGGIKKGLGAGRQLAKLGFKAATGKIAGGDFGNAIKGVGGAMKKGFDKDGVIGALKEGHKNAKGSLWNKDAAKKNIENITGAFKGEFAGDKGKENMKKVLGNVAQGADEFRKKDNTKGAFGLGRGNVDVNYSSLGQKFEAFAEKSTRGISSWAGLDDDGTAKSRKDRSILKQIFPDMVVDGDNGGKKIKMEHLSGDITFTGENGKLKTKALVDQDANGQYRMNPKAVDEYRKSPEFKSLDRETQLTFDKYTQGQQREDLTMFKQCLDQMTQVTQALANAKQFNSQIEAKVKIENPNLKIDSDEFKAAMKSAGAIDISTLTDQQEVLVNTMEGIKNQGYEIDGKEVSIANIDNALNKANEDYSKTTSELSDLKKKVEAASSSGDKK